MLYYLGVFVLVFLQNSVESCRHHHRGVKCKVSEGLKHEARMELLKECLAKNYDISDDSQCYEELGCFPTSFPWTSLLRPFPAPMPPSEINVQLQCYTRANPSKMYNIRLWPRISLNRCPFNRRKTTVFLSHGFLNFGNVSWLHEFKDRYLQKVDANFFIIDWGQGALLLNYLQASSNTRIVGAEVARFIKFVQNNHRFDVDNIHIIGHSLGAHISSYVAKRIPGIGRLTALDPAQPGFEGTDSEVRLDQSDAKYVEVVHTNGAPFIPLLGYGMIYPHGHVDFYINGGMHQPGCEELATKPEINDIKDLAQYSLEVVAQWVCCSHCRSYEIYMRTIQDNCIVWGRKATFTESVVNAGTVGLTEKIFSKNNKCTSETCIPLSLDTPKFKARGVFAATTNIKEPFCETNPEVNMKLLEEISTNSDSDQDAGN